MTFFRMFSFVAARDSDSQTNACNKRMSVLKTFPAYET